MLWKAAIFAFAASFLTYFVGHFMFSHHETIDDETEFQRARMDAVPGNEQGLMQLNDHPDNSFHRVHGYDLSEVEYAYDFEVDRIERNHENSTNYALTEQLPIILWWTPFTGEEGTIKKCSTGSCYYTQDRKFFSHNLTQVLMFYGTNLNDSDLPLPKKDYHEWALLHEESPKNNLLFHHEDFVTLFNHTCTFRQESDYPITTQYLPSLSKLQEKPVMNFTEKEKLGLAPAIYLQSGCNPPSDRDAYVNELMKYMQIDSYGQCLKNKELPNHLESPLTMHDDSLKDFVGKYKFAITFENALCKDYITEKLWRPLVAGTIPVYKGAPNILEWLPNKNSAILVDDFNSPEHLANFLQSIAMNATALNNYLLHKKNRIANKKLVERMSSRPWGVNDFNKMSFITGFECFVCDRIHKNRKLKTEEKNPVRYIADLEHYGCPKPTRYPYATPSNSEEWERDTWTYEYEDAQYKAGVLRKSVQGG